MCLQGVGAPPWKLGSLLQGRELLQAGLVTTWYTVIMQSCPILLWGLGQFLEHHSLPSEAREMMKNENWVDAQPPMPSSGANAIAVPCIPSSHCGYRLV